MKKTGYRIITEQQTIEQLRADEASNSTPLHAKRSKAIKKTPKGPSSLERKFTALLDSHFSDHPPYESEYRFHPTRRWRIDFAFLGDAYNHRTAVELEGATFSGGRHTRGLGFQKDCEKYNELALSGFLLLRYTAYDLKTDPERVISDLRRALSR